MLNKLFVQRIKEREILTKEETSSIFANIPTLQDMHLELFLARLSSLFFYSLFIFFSVLIGLSICQVLQDLLKKNKPNDHKDNPQPSDQPTQDTDKALIENFIPGVMEEGLGDVFLSRANLFKHYAV